MTERTARHGLPLLISGQGQKDVTHNEALVMLDALVSGVTEARTLGESPANPEVGASWLVADPASGIWTGRAGELAIWTGSGWRFAQIPDGMQFYVKAEGLTVRRAGSAWQSIAPIGAPAAPIAPPNGGSVIDLEARAAIVALAGRLQQLGLVAV